MKGSQDSAIISTKINQYTESEKYDFNLESQGETNTWHLFFFLLISSILNIRLQKDYHCVSYFSFQSSWWTIPN